MLLTHVFLGRAHEVAKLLDRGIAVDACDPDGWCALLLGAAEGQTEIVELLLAKGADATARLDGDTALMLAATRGHTAVVARLLQHRTDGNVVDARRPSTFVLPSHSKILCSAQPNRACGARLLLWRLQAAKLR